MGSLLALTFGVMVLFLLFRAVHRFDVHNFPGWVLILLFLFVLLPGLAIGIGLALFGFLGTLVESPGLTMLGLLALVVFGGGWLIDRLFPRPTKESDPMMSRGMDSRTSKAVAKRLKAYGAKRQEGDDWGGPRPESGELVASNPFAFLVAVAFDRGMPWRKAWQIPVEIHHKGLLEPRLLAEMPRPELVDLLDSLPIRPRYGTTQGARTLSDAARLVTERFDGDAGAIWNGASPREASKTLQEIHGVGSGIASMATRILYDDFGCFRGQEYQIDVKPDVHVLRVFQRAGLIGSNSEKEAVEVARRLSPDFPGRLDWPAWRIGQVWCHPAQPDCGGCWLAAVCPRHVY